MSENNEEEIDTLSDRDAALLFQLSELSYRLNELMARIQPSDEKPEFVEWALAKPDSFESDTRTLNVIHRIRVAKFGKDDGLEYSDNWKDLELNGDLTLGTNDLRIFASIISEEYTLKRGGRSLSSTVATACKKLGELSGKVQGCFA